MTHHDEEGKIYCIVCKLREFLYQLHIPDHNLIKCDRCHIVFRVPIISSEDLKDLYAEKYPSYLDEKSLEKYRIDLFEEQLDKINSVVKDKGSLLDVGCGYGKFLELAAKGGWEVVGTELFPVACKYINEELGLKAFYGELKEIDFQDNSFDVVTLWHVLHHMYDPLEQISEISRILKPGGVIFIRSPNFSFNYISYEISHLVENIVKKLFHKNLNLCSKLSVFHNSNYSPSGIYYLLKATGFFQIVVKNGKPTWGDPYRAFPNIGNSAMSILKRIAYVFFEALYTISNKRIILGPTLEIWGKKEHKVARIDL